MGWGGGANFFHYGMTYAYEYAFLLYREANVRIPQILSKKWVCCYSGMGETGMAPGCANEPPATPRRGKTGRVEKW